MKKAAANVVRQGCSPYLSQKPIEGVAVATPSIIIIFTVPKKERGAPEGPAPRRASNKEDKWTHNVHRLYYIPQTPSRKPGWGLFFCRKKTVNVQLKYLYIGTG